tara:strand:- start:84 stop:374 length:291 start_codon:yes stop_codon:yes gene_type:complete
MSQDNQPQGDREQDTENKGIRASWVETANKLLLGRKIVKVEYIPVKETDEMMWEHQPVCFLLDNGDWVYPMADDEGNDAGALAVGKDLLPVLRGDK